MARPTTPSFYELFGGLSEEPGTELENTESTALENLYVRGRGQYLQRRKGTAILEDWETDGIISGLEWARIDSTDYLITVFNGDIYDSLASTDYVYGGTNRFNTRPSDQVNGAFIANKLYLGNGNDSNVRWDGTWLYQVTPEKPATGAVVVTGLAAAITGTYKYAITFLSADSVDSEPVIAATGFVMAGHSGEFSAIPLAAATDNSTARRIWRTLSSGSIYYLVGTISDNTTTTFSDTTLDANVDTSVELDLQAVAFPPCQYLVNHQERLLGVYCNASGEGDTRTLYISNYQVPELCPLVAPLDEVDNPDLGARIPLPDIGTAVASFGNVALVWTAGACWRLIGDNPNNWSFEKWIDNGCVAHRSVATHRNVLVWLGPDGVYLAESWGQVTRISDPIREEFEDYAATSMAGAHAFIWDDRYYLCFIDRAFFFDLKYRVWGKLTAWDWANTAVSFNTGMLRERVFAADDLTLQTWELETGTEDNGEPIAVRWASKDKDLGHFGREKRVHRVIAMFTASSGDATVSLYTNGALLDTFTQDLSEIRRTGSEVSILDDRASEGARDEFFRLEVESSTTADDFRLLRAGFHYTLVT